MKNIAFGLVLFVLTGRSIAAEIVVGECFSSPFFALDEIFNYVYIFKENTYFLITSTSKSLFHKFWRMTNS